MLARLPTLRSSKYSGNPEVRVMVVCTLLSKGHFPVASNIHFFFRCTETENF
jgi:hypothetical protein